MPSLTGELHLRSSFSLVVFDTFSSKLSWFENTCKVPPPQNTLGASLIWIYVHALTSKLLCR